MEQNYNDKTAWERSQHADAVARGQIQQPLGGSGLASCAVVGALITVALWLTVLAFRKGVTWLLAESPVAKMFPSYIDDVSSWVLKTVILIGLLPGSLAATALLLRNTRLRLLAWLLAGAAVLGIPGLVYLCLVTASRYIGVV